MVAKGVGQCERRGTLSIMSILFEPVKMNQMELRNRFVRSATYDGCAERSGRVSEQQIEIYSELAEGGAGLIITGFTYVHPSGQRFAFQNSLAADDYISGLKKLTTSVHNRGAKIAIQLFHAGREGASFLRTQNREGIAPSFIDDDPFLMEREYKAMREEEIWDVIHAFGDSAKRAREAGFDAVQLHGAHGYLLSQFLSPFTNRRSDDWGGGLETRLRFHKEIYLDIRAKVGEDYPVFIKVGVQDGFSGGLEISEGKLASQLLAQWGFDALEISVGVRGERFEGTEFRTKINNISREGYFRDWCKAIKCQVTVPIMMVGGLRTFELMEEIVQKGEADFISLSRPLIREPQIINDWKMGDRHRAACVSCNKCLEVLRREEKLYCAQLKVERNICK
jgi:2,4-dienoyl-CoA reductase-like NADH-dependent reductase (Old Yellow Enzyme family)